MSSENPYEAPKSELTDPHHVGVVRDSELAGRFTRFAAAFVDGLIQIAVVFPMIYVLGGWDYLIGQQSPTLKFSLVAGALGFLVFLLVNGYLLKTNGQTIGKRLTGIRIADLDGGVPDFATLILRRYLPVTLVANVPVVGPYLSLVDVLFIFRGDRRCLHDLIAGTQVVLTGSRGRVA